MWICWSISCFRIKARAGYYPGRLLTYYSYNNSQLLEIKKEQWVASVCLCWQCAVARCHCSRRHTLNNVTSLPLSGWQQNNKSRSDKKKKTSSHQAAFQKAVIKWRYGYALFRKPALVFIVMFFCANVLVFMWVRMCVFAPLSLDVNVQSLLL